MRRLRVKIDDRWYNVEVGEWEGTAIKVLVDQEPVVVDLGPAAVSTEAERVDTPPTSTPTGSADTNDENAVRSPLPGVILSVDVRVGESVAAGTKVCVIESMKMEQALLAPKDGTIKAIHVKQGQNVLIGDTIAELD